MKTASERAVVSSAPTPVMAPTRTEGTPLSTTVARVRSRLQMVAKCVQKGGTSNFAKQRVESLDHHPTPVFECTRPQSPVLLPAVGPPTPPDTPSPPIVSERDPLGLWDRPRIRSPRTVKVIEKRAFIRDEIRPATRELEEAGMLPGAKPIDSAPE